MKLQEVSKDESVWQGLIERDFPHMIVEKTISVKENYVQEFKLGIPFRWDPSLCNSEITISSDQLSAFPDNGNWNMVFGDRLLVPGRRYRWSLRIDRDDQDYITFQTGVVVGDVPRNMYRKFIGATTTPFTFYSVNEYGRGTHGVNSPGILNELKVGDTIHFETTTAGDLVIWSEPCIKLVYTGVLAAAAVGDKPVRAGLVLSGEGVQLTLVRGKAYVPST